MCNEKCKKHKAKRAERIGVGVAKRLALVQAVIWAKRTEAGDICELDPLLVEEATCTRTVSSTLVDELAHQGHLLVRHNKRLRCKVCNVYRANRQFRFWSRHPCFPRPSAAVVISQFRHKKRQHISTSVGNSCHVLGQSGERSKTSNKHDEKELHHWVVRISSAHTATWNFSLCLLPLNLKLISHTLINVVITPSLKLPSRVAKVSMFCRNCMVVAWRARGGKLLPLRTLLDPELHYGQISITQKDGTPPVPRRNAHNGTWYIAWHLLLVAQSFLCGTSGCTGSCPLSVVENGYNAGKKPATCRTCGKLFPRPNTSGIKSRIASPTRSQKSSVSSWSEALCEQSRSQVETVLPAAMGPCAPSEPVPFSSGFVVTSEHAVISGLSAGSFALPLCKACLAWIVRKLMDSAEWSRCHVPPASRCFSLLVQRSQVNMP